MVYFLMYYFSDAKQLFGTHMLVMHAHDIKEEVVLKCYWVGDTLAWTHAIGTR